MWSYCRSILSARANGHWLTAVVTAALQSLVGKRASDDGDGCLGVPLMTDILGVLERFQSCPKH
jgi:hypothetical protein